MCCLHSFCSVVLACALAGALTSPVVATAGIHSPRPPEDRSDPLTLDNAIRIALQGNPGLAEIKARAEAMAAVPSQAGSLPDPSISLNALNFPVDTFRFDQEPMTQLQVAVSQEIPFPGKLDLREKAAEYEAEAAGMSAEEERQRLVKDVKATWWQLFYLDRALEIIARNEDLLRQFVQITQTKYKVGEGLQQDVLLAQVELSQLLERDIQLGAARRNEAARLNALLARPVTDPVGLPVDSGGPLPDLYPDETLIQIADESRPRLAEFASRLKAADARVDLARRDLLPDFKLGAGYGFRGGENVDGSSRPDFLSLQFKMSVPLYSDRKQARGVDQRNSERLARQYALQDERRRIHADIVSARSEYEQYREQTLLLETGIIPQSRQTVSSMLSGYQVSNVDFLNLVRAQITLYNHETRYWQIFTEARRTLARLVSTVGSEEVYDE
jgi:cobalt-zinc-cadmium efflux system outer membrane protein